MNNNKIEILKNSEHINEKKRDGPYRGLGDLSLSSDPLDLAKWSQRNTVILQLSSAILQPHRGSAGVFLLLRVSVSYSAPTDLPRRAAY